MSSDSDDDDSVYNQYSDPWAARNLVEKKGWVANKYGGLLSPDAVKSYAKQGHTVTPDSKIHGNKSAKEMVKGKK
jgi:hypothetical protein